jgi:hypothetical protein
MSTGIYETIEKYIDYKEKSSEIEKKLEKYRKIIEEYMMNQNLTEIKHNGVTLKKTLSSRESIAKKDLPSDIWGKYCKTSRFTVITVSKSKMKKSM